MSTFRRLLTISAGVSLMMTPVACHQGAADQADAVNQDDPDALTDFTTSYFNQWRQERAEHTLHVTEVPSNDEERRLAEIRADIASSPLGQRLLTDLADTHTAIGGNAAYETDDPGTYASYLYNVDMVLLRDDAPRGRQILHAAHELRHAWQDERGLMGDGFDLHQQDHAARIFMTEADARAFAVAVAWELKQAGDSDAWDAAMGMGIYRQTATNFENRMTERLGEAPDGAGHSDYTDADIRSAMGEAYKTWFTRQSIRAPYIEGIRATTEEHNGVWPGYQALPADITRKLGQLPDDPQGARGASYLGRSDLELAKHHARIAFPVLVAGRHDSSPAALPANDDREPVARVRLGRTL